MKNKKELLKETKRRIFERIFFKFLACTLIVAALVIGLEAAIVVASNTQKDAIIITLSIMVCLVISAAIIARFWCDTEFRDYAKLKELEEE